MIYNTLIVEDDYLIRQGLKKIIETLHPSFKVAFEASNGYEALEILQHNTIHLVISDVKMPHMDGITLVKKITHIYPDINIIMLSGYSDYEYVRESLKHGAIDYLLKPVEKEELKVLLDKCAGSFAPASFYGEKVEYNIIQTNEAFIKQKSKELIKYVNKGNEQGIKQCIQEIGNIIRQDRLEPNLAKSIFINIYMEFKDFYKEYTNIFMDTSSYSKGINSLNTLQEIIEYCINFYIKLCSYVNTGTEQSTTPIIEITKKYIEEHYMEQISLSTLAQICFVSPSYLCTLFKKKTGLSIIDYINEIRVENAKKYLKDIKLKTFEIAELVGFSDATYFSRVFKNITGISPSDYRKKFYNQVNTKS